MKTVFVLISASMLALFASTGCAPGDRAKAPAPTRAELPRYETPAPVLSVDVGVEGAGSARGNRIVPQYNKIELSAKDREFLGVKEDPQVDALAFYRPPPRPDRGVSVEAVNLYGICEAGGMTVGRGLYSPLYFNYGYAGRHSGVAQWRHYIAGVCHGRENTGFVGDTWTIQVGECLPKSKAASEKNASR